MTIEQKINKTIKEKGEHWPPIEKWIWRGFPNPPKKKYEVSLEKNTKKRILLQILDADLTECLTSPSEYIREYKKWLMENK